MTYYSLISLVKQVSTQLYNLGLQISTAESCTGGGLACLLTEIPHSSNWFERGFVTYSNLSKIELLGVDPTLIAQHGAVSEEVASAMAQGALKHSAADIAVAITGIAGPGGGSLKKPIGTVCFAWVQRNFTTTHLTCHFPSTTRKKLRQLACEKALEGLLSLLNRQPPGK